MINAQPKQKIKKHEKNSPALDTIWLLSVNNLAIPRSHADDHIDIFQRRFFSSFLWIQCLLRNEASYPLVFFLAFWSQWFHGIQWETFLNKYFLGYFDFNFSVFQSFHCQQSPRFLRKIWSVIFLLRFSIYNIHIFVVFIS